MRAITSLRLSFAGVMLALLGGCASLNLNWPDEESREPASTSGTRQPSRSVNSTSIATTESAVEIRRTSLAGRAVDANELGYFMDVHEARLRQAVVDSPIELRRGDARLVLVIPGTTGFTTGSATLGAEVTEPLIAVAAVLSEFDRTLLTVNGHTDNSGTPSFNQQLSQQRALAVARFFRQHGIAAERLAALGHGEKQPVAGNETAEGRTANRRTEIFIEPIRRGSEPQSNEQRVDGQPRAVSSPLNEG